MRAENRGVFIGLEPDVLRSRGMGKPALFKLITGLALAISALAFQNCAESQKGAGEGPAGSNDRVIGSVSQYNKLVYDPGLEFSGGSSSVRVEVDVLDGQLTLRLNSSPARQCVLDKGRLESLRAVLDDAQICSPGPLPPGYAACLAIGLADIELSNGADRVQLRPVICNSGTYLCGGKDQLLRELLKDIRDRAPVDCL